jgi:hypothetical protein
MMKKITAIIAIFFTITSCTKDYKNTIIPGTQWVALEIDFFSKKKYTDCFNEVDLDVVFQHSSGEIIKIPAFWDGGERWKVRFAPTLTGLWEYKAICTDRSNSGLDNKVGKIEVRPYEGNLAIFKRGFIKTFPGKRYFMYNDNTPFFYLGDTHWGMPRELIDSSTVPGYNSHFKYIVDKRVEQGFTVYQSEPIDAKYNLSDGLTSEDIGGFIDLDRRFRYIAKKGLVHANAQLFFASELGFNGKKYSGEYLEKLCRYWVARYASFPVLWTTAQEVDNDFYHGRMRDGKDLNPYYNAETNPWKQVASLIHKHDPYKHPQTAHQEFSSINGDGTVASNSSFKDLQGHSWFGAQWAPAKESQLDFRIPKDFWYNGQGKPVVNYEGHYDHLWTKEFGARMQGWTAFLNGMFGHGYGAIDIWLYDSTYDMENESVRGNVTITVEDKKTKWNESVEFQSAYQMGYMRNFFEAFDWWNLVPRFDDENYFINDSSFYSILSKGNNLFVVYFYNLNRNTGKLNGLENKTYSVQWFNPIDGKFLKSKKVSVTNNSYIIGEKPDTNDWVLLVKIL